MNGLSQILLFLMQVAGWSGLFLGIALLFAPIPTLRLSNALGRYDPIAWLDRRHFVERFFYRHHRIFGVFIVVGALYASYFLSVGNINGRTVLLSDELIVNALRFLWVANAMLVVFGVMVFIRPSMLKHIEKRANRWVEVGMPNEWRARTRTLGERLHDSPRLAGLLLCAGGLYIVTFISVL